MTWLMVSLYLHDAMFKQSRLTFIQAQKENDADEALERAYIIYQKLPLFMRNWQPLTGGKKTFCSMRFARNRSRLQAVPEGSDHVRGFTPTGMLLDEACFQSDVEKTVAAVVPALGLHGRLTMVSSAAPSYLELLAFAKTFV